MPLKSTAPSKPITGNAAKYLCYREAWHRILLAREHGFPFEAIAILESIITDRLRSYLDVVGAPRGRGYESLGKLVKRWRKVHPQSAPYGAFVDLRSAVNEWRDKRNQAVHGIAHPPADAPTTHIDEFLIVVETAAEEGSILARALCKWCEQAVRGAGKNREVQPGEPAKESREPSSPIR